MSKVLDRHFPISLPLGALPETADDSSLESNSGSPRAASPKSASRRSASGLDSGSELTPELNLSPQLDPELELSPEPNPELSPQPNPELSPQPNVELSPGSGSNASPDAHSDAHSHGELRTESPKVEVKERRPAPKLEPPKTSQLHSIRSKLLRTRAKTPKPKKTFARQSSIGAQAEQLFRSLLDKTCVLPAAVSGLYGPECYWKLDRDFFKMLLGSHAEDAPAIKDIPLNLIGLESKASPFEIGVTVSRGAQFKCDSTSSAKIGCEFASATIFCSSPSDELQELRQLTAQINAQTDSIRDWQFLVAYNFEVDGRSEIAIRNSEKAFKILDTQAILNYLVAAGERAGFEKHPSVDRGEPQKIKERFLEWLKRKRKKESRRPVPGPLKESLKYHEDPPPASSFENGFPRVLTFWVADPSSPRDFPRLGHLKCAKCADDDALYYATTAVALMAHERPIPVEKFPKHYGTPSPSRKSSVDESRERTVWLDTLKATAMARLKDATEADCTDVRLDDRDNPIAGIALDNAVAHVYFAKGNAFCRIALPGDKFHKYPIMQGGERPVAFTSADKDDFFRVYPDSFKRTYILKIGNCIIPVAPSTIGAYFTSSE